MPGYGVVEAPDVDALRTRTRQPNHPDTRFDWDRRRDRANRLDRSMDRPELPRPDPSRMDQPL